MRLGGCSLLGSKIGSRAVNLAKPLQETSAQKFGIGMLGYLNAPFTASHSTLAALSSTYCHRYSAIQLTVRRDLLRSVQVFQSPQF